MKNIVYDFHVHAREQGMPEFYDSVKVYAPLGGAVYMMNFRSELDLSDPDIAVRFVDKYYRDIKKITDPINPGHRPLLMPVLGGKMKPADLESFLLKARAAGVPIVGCKIFTQGQSTNSGYAPSTPQAVELIKVLEAVNMPLALHMEDVDEKNATLKERTAIEKVLPQFVFNQGGQKRSIPISIEHITDVKTIEFVKANDNIYCSIMPHHLALSQEMLGVTDRAEAAAQLAKYNPFFFCKPIITTEENRTKLQEFWRSGHERIICGTDAAPHEISKKTAETPAAGIFFGGRIEEAFANATYLPGMDLAAHLYKVKEILLKTTQNGARFYGVDLDGSSEYTFSQTLTPTNNKLTAVRDVLPLMITRRANYFNPNHPRENI
ncbi:MAG: amidohydrolase family protein [Lactobacillales bacterium]|jgi:dihydroorotase|nr:amidohydrolase family protein [Lactobacillales bacterium]